MRRFFCSLLLAGIPTVFAQADEESNHPLTVPSREAPPDSTVLFQGMDTSAWERPRAARADSNTTENADESDSRWIVDQEALTSQEGASDLQTKATFGDGVYHLDFLIPDDSSSEHGSSNGLGGILIDNRWTIRIVDSHGANSLDDTATCGAILGLAAPTKNACAPPGTWQEMEIAVKHRDEETTELSVWLNGIHIHDQVRVDENLLRLSMSSERAPPPARFVSTLEEAALCDMSRDFTAVIRFRAKEQNQGPLFSKVHPTDPHRVNDKVVFIANRRLHYDIGWVGVVSTKHEVSDGDWHTAALRSRDGVAELYLDGEKAAERTGFTSPDSENAVFKIGAGAPNFPEENGNQWNCAIASFQFYSEAISDQDMELTGASEPIERHQPVLEWKGDDGVSRKEFAEAEDGGPLALRAGTSQIRFANIWVRPLGDIDHAGIVQAWNDEALARGEKIYQGLCFACHGNLQQEGSLPTSRPFWKESFKNGKDPHSLYLTLKNGYNQMPPQPWLTPKQAYDVIHYIRETFLLTHNQEEYMEITEEYLAGLPKGMSTENRLTQEQIDYARGPQYLRMDFGPMLNWTFEAAPDNIAYKGIAIRLDEGPGGVSKGRHWMLYDHDTMRVAAAWSGNAFVDWKGIAFDQSHGTHASIVGERTLVNPVGPGWANPFDGSWEDPRLRGRDGKPYGPLPRPWTRFQGQYVHGDKVILAYTVGDAEILEMPGLVQVDPVPVFSRTLNIGKSSRDLQLRVGPQDVGALVTGQSEAILEVQNGYQVLAIPADATPISLKVLIGNTDPQALYIASLVTGTAEDLTDYTKGGPARWPGSVTTEGSMGRSDGPFAVDEITYPKENPWHSWMRIGAFDFMEDGERAAVATWLGDVWIVDGLSGEFAEHRWKRICTGLFQPLGVKVVDATIHVTCRDQLAKLHDLNADGEIDFIECFNNDHQVTEHFHEFAMGLQRDDEGNFYYAKSARHALPALVPHHGTLLRVSPDGSNTDIVATGFRAANGVCLNPDGTFIVTDQEGHWNPKNRINYVKEGGFYGNMYGYHDVTDSSDEAMEQPLCWITNAFDRSPGELVWVPENAAWGPLNGKLLNLSYGMGRIFLVPHEKIDGQAQGGMVSLGLDFPTGIMRGRFHPSNGQLYATGMFAWAGNKHQDGGFYRIRFTGQPANLPIELHANSNGIRLGFSDPLHPESAGRAENYQIRVWSLKRTKNYGSQHYDEHPLTVAAAEVSPDGKSVFLRIPDIAPTWCMEIAIDVKDARGEPVLGVIHNTIHRLPESGDESGHSQSDAASSP